VHADARPGLDIAVIVSKTASRIFAEGEWIVPATRLQNVTRRIGRAVPAPHEHPPPVTLSG